ncbi:hypothetical protein E4U19_005472 [Claviceps sp. Clav32 group G5]|nr:hypothetical protein E4U19_005472 [Claviceps sp. Clav32 group G5]KAG6043336.1 hypothetical protein E4U39_004667 [Claviceps sp. Clav50 group G5]
MLSHLRFHRRGASTPSSPAPEDSSSISPLSTSVPPQALDSASPHNLNPNSAIPSNAPLLPPITSIISSELDPRREKQNTTGLTSESRPQQTQRLSYNGDSGFIGGAALRNYRRDVEAQQIPTGKDAMARISTTQFEDKSQHRNHRNQEVATELPIKPHMKKIMSFSTPSDVKRAHSSKLGRRPAGARLPPEVPLLMSNPPAAVGVETQRAKKGLPFLKNPMSTLLMRKKNNQPSPDLRPILSKNKDEEPAYDPRIKGTRVHDFSAPRKSREAHMTSYSVPQITAGTTSTAEQSVLPATSTGATENSSQEQNGASESLNRSSIPSQLSRPIAIASRDASSSSVYSSSDQDHEGVDAVTTCPPERDQESIIPSGDVDAEDVYKPVEAKVGVLSSSVRTTRSRNKSLSEIRISAIPRHMKSTSSRFSFDMGGAAKQEKLLEERHRQRELARTTTRHDGNLDSRFDEFDEDAFDYDAMMDDDGLEERIPGVNADFEDGDFLESSDTDVEADPCNDQENFAGFVFQRSMTVSTSASPPGSGMVLTPRDADGNPIGVVMSNETPETSPFADFSQVHAVCHMDGDQKGAAESGDYYSTKSALSQRNNEDDLYYDDGMIGLEENEEEYISSGHGIVSLETNEQPFDESIFDDNDTDQFGRPVPGAFQYAQSLRRATQQHDLTRENNPMSRLSAPPAVLRCNTHLSLHTEDTVHHSTVRESTDDANQPRDAESLNHGAKSIAAYQAALAAAAHRAAATGKFRRSSSSSSASCLVEDARDLTVDEDEDDDEDKLEDEPEDEIPGYDTLADDFDLGDDAIIAEANASALANDADGWYGQEFGFYSAPPTSHATTSYAAGASSIQGYEYANGGFFGPGGTYGLHRSTSGRMISREPNLTPITEKSEHSNRNSLMSLGNLANSTSTPVVQNPGLAQLAMMTDSQDDQMTLSALLKLRSRTWGGSQASLTPSREGSPRSERGESTNSTWLSNPLGAVDGQINHTHSKKLSTCLATCSYDEPDNTSASGSPTMTMATASFDHGQKPSVGQEDPMRSLGEYGGTDSCKSCSEVASDS